MGILGSYCVHESCQILSSHVKYKILVTLCLIRSLSHGRVMIF